MDSCANLSLHAARRSVLRVDTLRHKSGGKFNGLVVRSQAQPPPAYRIRRATLADVPSVCKLCSQVAIAQEFERFRDVGEDQRDFIDKMQDSMTISFQTQLVKQLEVTLKQKHEASRFSREYRLRRQAQRLRAQLAAIRGEGATRLHFPSAEEKRQLSKWRRSRQFVCLLVEHLPPSPTPSPYPHPSPHTSQADAEPAPPAEVVGVLTLSLFPAEALLPPPLPTSAPLRLYVSNMAVHEQHRRKGLATALLATCERIGACWLHDSLWLHVNYGNSSAQRLYQQLGYAVQSQDPWWRVPYRRILLSKTIPALNCQPGRDLPQAEERVSGSVKDNVFVWNVTQGMDG